VLYNTQGLVHILALSSRGNLIPGGGGYDLFSYVSINLYKEVSNPPLNMVVGEASENEVPNQLNARHSRPRSLYINSPKFQSCC